MIDLIFGFFGDNYVIFVIEFDFIAGDVKILCIECLLIVLISLIVIVNCIGILG